MSTLADFTIDSELSRRGRSAVYRAHRADGPSVIVKTLRPEAASGTGVAQLRHEWRMLERIESDHVPRGEAFLHEPGRYTAIVMQDIGALETLQDVSPGRLEPDAVLQVAMAVTSALEAAHRLGITHYDVKPSNIIRAPDGHVQLIDFGLAMQLETEEPELSGREDVIGTLPYISPEQTGRMNCRVDHRSDLYSLGVVLYRLSAGELPFRANDAMGWVHAHIATEAPPLDPRSTGAPPMLCAIVERLVAKDREQRYQSASGLLADLRRCANQLARGEFEDPIELGRDDHSDLFRIPDLLYGREGEVERLLRSFERVSPGGRAQLVLVDGAPGIGKSSLVRELRKPLTLRHAMMISGKFDLLQRATPLTGVVAALEDLVRQLLKESDESMAEWARVIQAGVGRNGRVLLELVPSLELIIGAQPPVMELGGMERLNRLKHVMEKFFRALAERAQPLVLFIDDLQWIDPASLVVLEHLLGSEDTGSLTVVGAYRSNEVDAAHPLMKSLTQLQGSGLAVEHLHLGRLQDSAVRSLLADTLHCDASETGELAQIASEKTGGNPFYLRQFLGALQREGVIHYDHPSARWRWDSPASAAAASTENVSELLMERFAELPEDARRLLQLAGCIGNRFDLATLATVANGSPVDTFAGLWPALQWRLLLAEGSVLARLRDSEPHPDDRLSEDEARTMTFRFAHDRIQQAAAASLGQGTERSAAHLTIGRTLRATLSDDAPAARHFEVADQLNAGSGLISNNGERLELARLDLRCGQGATAATAYNSAVRYLGKAAELLDAAKGESGQGRLWFDIHLELARALYLTVQFDAAAAEYPELLRRAESDEERLAINAVRLEHSMLAVDYEEGFSACRAAFAILGMELPSDEDAEDLVKREMGLVEENLGGRPIAALLEAPTLTDERELRRLEDLNRLALLTYLSGSWTLNAWAIARMTNISLLHGNVGISGFAYAFFGFLMSMEGRHERSQAFGKLGVALADRFRDPSVYGRAYLMYYAFSSYYAKPLRQLSDPMYQAYPVSLEGGDLAYASYLLVIADYFRFAGGLPLSEVRSDILRHAPFLVRSAPQSFRLFTLPYMVYAVSALGDEPTTDLGFEYDPDTHLKEVAEIPIGRAWHNAGLLKVEAYTGVQQDLQTLADRVEAITLGVAGQYLIPESTFYAALQVAALLRGVPQQPLSDEERELAETLLEAWQGSVGEAAEQCPANFAHMHALVQAERARAREDHGGALIHYERAVDMAHQQRCWDKEALARQLMGECFLDQGARNTGEAHLRVAHEVYERWGGRAAMRTLRERHPELRLSSSGSGEPRQAQLEDQSTGSDSQGTQPLPVSQQLDLHTVTRATRAISKETSLQGLLERLAQILRDHLGARRCLVLRGGRTGWSPVASSVVEGTPQTGFASSVTNYVQRTGESLILDDPQLDDDWLADDHIRTHEPRSLLCAPVRRNDRTLALVYADNDLAAGAFGPEHRTLLDTVLAQAAISMDNARLFEELDQERERWHSLVDNAADLFLVVDRKHRIEFVNRATDGFQFAPQMGSRIEATFVGEAGDLVRAAVDQAFETEALVSREMEMNGSSRPQHLTLRVGPIRSAGAVDRVAVILTDVSERRDLTEQLRQSQKMEAVGTLAGGVAHDFNNLLTVILGSCELARLNIKDESTLAFLDDIAEAGGSASALTRKLLAFSRKQVLQPQLLDVDELVRQATRLLDRMLGEDVSLVLDLQAEGGLVRVDPGGLEQVVMNLAVNARDAMPRGGTLTVRTQLVSDPGPLVALDVQDDGIGMDVDIQDRVFEPFFTTKAAGKGTGLGLAMVYGIVQQSGGQVQFTSTLGEGTCVRVLLPVQEEHRAGADSMHPAGPAPQGSETILFVEDDPHLRSIVASMLERLGYTVLTAPNSESALELGERIQRVELLFTDVVMPGLSGPELAERLQLRFPGLPVLFTSGYTDDAILRHGVLAGTVKMIPKPFSLAAMARKVREVLDARV